MATKFIMVIFYLKVDLIFFFKLNFILVRYIISRYYKSIILIIIQKMGISLIIINIFSQNHNLKHYI